MDIRKHLGALSVGECGTVSAVLTEDRMRRRFFDVGLIIGTTVECVGKSPLGDPIAYRIRGKIIAIRASDAKGVLLE